MEKTRIFVLPGEIALTRQPSEIVTLLGSCVAVCLYNRKLKFGGMNHFLLPTGTAAGMGAKYGDQSTKKLVESMLKVDRDPANLEARIYGGAAVVGHLDSGKNIGDQNVAVAERVLASFGIAIVAREVGGGNGRRIFFDNATGAVTVKMVERSELARQAEEKKQTLTGRKIRTLIVDDSATVRGILRQALSRDDQIEVVGEAEDAFMARNMILELDPDVVTLDIIMPRLDGISFLKKLMVHYPKPVIIVSSVAQKGSKMRLRAQEIGAVDVIDKEDLKLYQGLDTVAKILTQKVRAAAVTSVKKRDAKDIAHI